MPEPLMMIAGVTTIVANVLGISKSLYELIDATVNAPRILVNVAKEVRALFLVMGALQGLLVDFKASSQIQQASIPIFETLQQPLEDCLQVCTTLLIKIQKYTKPTGTIRTSKWTGFRWQFTEKETNVYRAHLAAYKSTVIIALTSANFANTTQNLNATTNLEAEVQCLKVQVEALQVNDNDGVINENGSQGTDRLFCLQRFMVATESVLSHSSSFAGNVKAFPPDRNQLLTHEEEHHGSMVNDFDSRGLDVDELKGTDVSEDRHELMPQLDLSPRGTRTIIQSTRSEDLRRLSCINLNAASTPLKNGLEFDSVDQYSHPSQDRVIQQLPSITAMDPSKDIKARYRNATRSTDTNRSRRRPTHQPELRSEDYAPSKRDLASLSKYMLPRIILAGANEPSELTTAHPQVEYIVPTGFPLAISSFQDSTNLELSSSPHPDDTTTIRTPPLASRERSTQNQ